MSLQNFLFIFTFNFGVIQLITYTKLFDTKLNGFFNTTYWKELPPFFKWLDVIIFLFSIGYQINFWFLN
jgi:hypothetical protein